MQSVSIRDQYHQVVFYDGVCMLCNWFIRLVLKADRKGMIHIAALQSAYAQNALEGFGIRADKLETVIFKQGDKVYTESEAAVRILAALGFPWRLLGVLIYVPAPVRNGIYQWIARNRYRWFGKADEVCLLPDERMRKQIIR